MTFKTVRQLGALFMLSLILALMISCGVALCKAEKAEQKTSLGTVAYTENPYIYNVGAVSDGRIVEGENLLINFSPLGTYQEYVEKIQFCGAPVSLFDGKKNPMVLTYSRAAHRIIEGRGCHQLIRVDNLEGQ